MSMEQMLRHFGLLGTHSLLSDWPKAANTQWCLQALATQTALQGQEQAKSPSHAWRETVALQHGGSEVGFGIL